jgi:polygalacturonase
VARICSLSAEQRRPIRLPVREETSEASFTSFDVSGPVTVKVTCSDSVMAAKILPASAGIAPSFSGNTVTFSVTKPGALTLEINGNWINSLHLFANPPETNVPSPNDPNVIYFGPGVHEIEHIETHAGQTIYLAPGAVVYGKPTGKMPNSAILGIVGDNVTVRGRGIIDGSLCPRGTRPLAWISGRNITIEGVVLRDSGGWTMNVRKCANLKIDNVKIFGWRGNSDGIDLCNSQHVEVGHCFLRTFDDLIVLKADKGQGEEHDVHVHDCVLWNEFAHALSLGAELREPLSDIHFSDCDVIHDKGREWVLRVYNCDSAHVSNVTWDNIRIEEARRLMSLWIGQAIWSKQTERGHIDNITFRNITAPVPEVPNSVADLVGFDATHSIDHVQFDHVVVGGKPLTPADVKHNAFVTGVTVTP